MATEGTPYTAIMKKHDEARGDGQTEEEVRRQIMADGTEREGQSKHIEREFEIGKDEAWSANMKRIHDEYLHESLESVRRLRSHFDRMTTNALGEDDARSKVSTQALQQAVLTQGQLSNVSLNLLGLISDRSWNLDEVSKLASQDTRQVEALATILATKLAELLGAKKE